MDFSPATLALVEAFGEAVTLHAAGGDMEVTGAWRSAYAGENAAGLPIDRPQHELLVTETSIVAANLIEGDTLTRLGVVYRIGDIQPDDAGGVTLKLERAA